MILLKRFVENPYVNIVVGLLLLMSGLSEAWGSLAEDIKAMHFGAHHGVILFGFFHVLKTIPDLVEGLEYVKKKEK